jgi:Ca-activated chloride channel family protein
MKQILLITDGNSNVGENPVTAAARALAQDIVVNVVGVVDEGDIGREGVAEIEGIARAGGGMSRIVTAAQLSRTVRMMTQQTVAGTIRTTVNRELRQLLGVESVAELPPPKRAEVVRMMEDLSETARLRVALLIDASASMKPKLAAVEEAIRDLALSLQARQGESAVAVFHFPGENEATPCVLDSPWTDRVDGLGALFRKIRVQGTTPTGPAIHHVVEYFRQTCGNIKDTTEPSDPWLGREGADVMRSDDVG